MGASDTRDRILAASLELFNSYGPASVSTHRIAAEAGISPGNLHYHFKSRAKVIERLVTRFESRLLPSIEASAGVQALDDLWLTLHLSFETIDAYRFVFRDIDFVLRECPALEPKATALTELCLAAAKASCRSMVDAGVLTASETATDAVAHQTVFAMTCWYTFRRLAPRPARPHGDAALGAYHCLSLLEPYVVGDNRDYLNYLRAKYLR